MKEANAEIIYGEKEKQAFMQATHVIFVNKTLGQRESGREDHLANMQEWLEINQIDIRRIPTTREIKRALKEYSGVRLTWRGKEVSRHQKRNKNEIKIEVGSSIHIVKKTELKNKSAYQNFIDVNSHLLQYIKKMDCSVVRDHCH